MGQVGFQIGWIPYLNLRPMHHEMQRLTGQGFTLLNGHPTTVNRWLCDGTVALAPCSSINLLKTDQIEMAMPIGVASEGPVHSVYIGVQREHADLMEFINRRQVELRNSFEEARATFGNDWKRMAVFMSNSSGKSRERRPVLPKIYFSPASAASVGLAKVLFKLWFGATEVENVLVRCEDSAAKTNFMNGERPWELVIGDEALVRRNEFATVIDLGQKWWQITGLPFVFAVWQTSLKDVPSGLKSVLVEAASVSSARMKIEPQIFAPDPWPLDSAGRKLDLASYWNVIQYKLTARHLQGLLLYLTLYSNLFECSRSDAIPSRLAKWSGQWGDFANL